MLRIYGSSREAMTSRRVDSLFAGRGGVLATIPPTSLL
ncbi:hypothetical protein PLANPX_1304 [Lacipirellula parvula]|uniref:Uncharacterized protein n=1 Tax=Lacipirellula parvula TaxID=2650471 RepID=A0A5K7X793_9BACT|nr:hypothetical protein PLANPX_1304 [Lacipirellula parvula]